MLDVNENGIEQRFVAHIFQCCQQHCSALLSDSDPTILLNIVETLLAAHIAINMLTCGHDK